MFEWNEGIPDIPDKDRRREPRIEVNMSAELIDSTGQILRENLAARIMDLSRNGMKMRVWHDAPAASRFCISIQFQEDVSLCIAEVIWKRETTAGMIYGLRIVHWTYLAPPLKYEMERKEKASAALNFEMDVEDVPVLGNVVLPFHSNLSLRP